MQKDGEREGRRNKGLSVLRKGVGNENDWTEKRRDV